MIAEMARQELNDALVRVLVHRKGITHVEKVKVVHTIIPWRRQITIRGWGDITTQWKTCELTPTRAKISTDIWPRAEVVHRWHIW